LSLRANGKLTNIPADGPKGQDCQHLKDKGFNWSKQKACLFLCAGYVIHKGYVMVHAGNVAVRSDNKGKQAGAELCQAHGKFD
jgi:hypothetical protein